MQLTIRTMTRSAAKIKSKFKKLGSASEPIKFYLIFMIIGGITLGVSLFTDVSLCIIYHITGIPCFSCGMGRAFRSLPDIRPAFAYHPLFFVVPFIPLLAVVNARVRNIASVVLIVLFIGVWIVRMVLLFPHTAPMEYNYNSLLEFIRSLFGV